MATYTLSSYTCGRCDGKGLLPHYSHVANGTCFACQGTGTVSYTERTDGTMMHKFEVITRYGDFYCATFSSQVLSDRDSSGYRTWGKVANFVEYNDAQKAREMWQQLRGAEHTQLAVTNIVANGNDETKVYQSWDW